MVHAPSQLQTTVYAAVEADMYYDEIFQCFVCGFIHVDQYNSDTEVDIKRCSRCMRVACTHICADGIEDFIRRCHVCEATMCNRCVEDWEAFQANKERNRPPEDAPGSQLQRPKCYCQSLLEPFYCPSPTPSEL